MEMISTVAEFVGANPSAVVTGERRLPNNNNYFIGNNPEKWYTDVPNYQEVVYKGIYPGIDLQYHFIENTLKYDFIVYSGGDPDTILIRYDGVDNMRVTSDGDLAIETRFGLFSEKSPVIYQEINGIKQGIIGRYEPRQPNSFGFAIEDEYNPLYPLVIDPTLAYSTYLGGTYYDEGLGIAVDDGNAYITGYTNSPDFPTTPQAYDRTYNGQYDVFVSKLPLAGNALIYSTYLGGTNNERGHDIAVDDGNAYITGGTWSSDFPTTLGAYDTTYNGYCDVFVTKLSPYGSILIYSTYLGGTSSDYGYGIAVAGGNASITGATYSSDFDFPITPGAYDTTYNGYSDAFVTQFRPAGNALAYSTYLGGIGYDYGYGIAVADGNAYITGGTNSSNFPTLGAYNPTYNGGYDVFVTKFPRYWQLPYLQYLPRRNP